MLIKNHKLTKEDEIEKIRIINDYCYWESILIIWAVYQITWILYKKDINILNRIKDITQRK